MPAISAPIIDCEQLFPLLGVKNINEAVEYYTTKLGFKLQFTWGDPTAYAGLSLGDVTIHMSSAMPAGYVAFASFVVGDAKELYQFHKSNGVEITQSPAERDYGLYDYGIRDLWGNQLSFGHYTYTFGPAIVVERVDVPVRLEKRLAALLFDLAEHKSMSIGSCLEEILLHTFEVIGDGVASPHTKSTFRYIEELKKKHGIDYDTHGSYRFKEE